MTKGLIRLFRRLRSKITGKPFFNVEIEHPIKEAFISAGVQYYMFEDIFNAPFNRAYECQTFYNELQMKVDKNYLDSYIKVMGEILSDPKGINISDIAIMTNQLAERSQFITDKDLLYKLASVMYFDESESPYKYDFTYGLKKVAKWKANDDVAAFFLNTPIKDFLPFTDLLERDLEGYLRTTELIKEQHQKTLLGQLSKRDASLGL